MSNTTALVKDCVSLRLATLCELKVPRRPSARAQYLGANLLHLNPAAQEPTVAGGQTSEGTRRARYAAHAPRCRSSLELADIEI
jgi:hypothetical protein